MPKIYELPARGAPRPSLPENVMVYVRLDKNINVRYFDTGVQVRSNRVIFVDNTWLEQGLNALWMPFGAEESIPPMCSFPSLFCVELQGKMDRAGKVCLRRTKFSW